ncbi:unnamed protein product, partial [Toxocara canis]|uniref:GRAS domain-containing protein n=1 Tax=Toxocara canis TaxID=6265 RepID=A0A183V816_TOXCA
AGGRGIGDGGGFGTVAAAAVAQAPAIPEVDFLLDEQSGRQHRCHNWLPAETCGSFAKITVANPVSARGVHDIVEMRRMERQGEVERKAGMEYFKHFDSCLLQM